MRLLIATFLSALVVFSTAAFAQTRIGWSDTAEQFRGRNGERLSFVCPPRNNAPIGNGVWGTDIYTDDSSICGAAVHVGAITVAGGTATVFILPGQASYRGTERNGIATNDYGTWAGSFRVVLTGAPQAPPAAATAAPQAPPAIVSARVTIVASTQGLGPAVLAALAADGTWVRIMRSGDPESRFTTRRPVVEISGGQIFFRYEWLGNQAQRVFDEGRVLCFFPNPEVAQVVLLLTAAGPRDAMCWDIAADDADRDGRVVYETIEVTIVPAVEEVAPLVALNATAFQFGVPAGPGLEFLVVGYGRDGAEIFRETTRERWLRGGRPVYLVEADQAVVRQNPPAKWCVGELTRRWGDIAEGDRDRMVCDDQPASAEGTYFFVNRVAGDPIPEGVETVPPADAVAEPVQCVQRVLNVRGFDAGPVDGGLGPRTRAAAAAYLQQMGLPTDALPALRNESAVQWCLALLDDATVTLAIPVAAGPQIERVVFFGGSADTELARLFPQDLSPRTIDGEELLAVSMPYWGFRGLRLVCLLAKEGYEFVDNPQDPPRLICVNVNAEAWAAEDGRVFDFPIQPSVQVPIVSATFTVVAALQGLEQNAIDAAMAANSMFIALHGTVNGNDQFATEMMPAPRISDGEIVFTYEFAGEAAQAVFDRGVMMCVFPGEGAAPYLRLLTRNGPQEVICFDIGAGDIARTVYNDGRLVYGTFGITLVPVPR